jgi:NAD(P)-dependent dehydrogenase (short-subunit alcohol dehydrogenase family)
MNRLEGKVAIVTGAASGLGRADVEALCRAGAQVLLTDVNTSAGEDVAAALNAVRRGCAAFATHDVRDEERWTEVVTEARRRFGGLHVLVNNAGVMVAATPETTTLEQFRFANSVMSEGVFLGCRAAIPVMNASGGGSIINMSSVASHLGYPVFFAYSAAKGAVRAMTKAAAVQFARDNIRVNSVHPGMLPPMRTSKMSADPKVRAAAIAAVPMKREGRVEEVAYANLFLASDEASYITGAELPVDGGYLAQ